MAKKIRNLLNEIDKKFKESEEVRIILNTLLFIKHTFPSLLFTTQIYLSI